MRSQSHCFSCSRLRNSFAQDWVLCYSCEEAVAACTHEISGQPAANVTLDLERLEGIPVSLCRASVYWSFSNVFPGSGVVEHLWKATASGDSRAERGASSAGRQLSPASTLRWAVRSTPSHADGVPAACLAPGPECRLTETHGRLSVWSPPGTCGPLSFLS